MNIDFYLILLGIALAIGFCHISILKFENRNKKMVDRPFLNEISNEIYALSYVKPFSLFIKNDENHPEVLDIKKLIVQANETHRLNYETYTTLKYVLFLGLLGLSILFCMSAKPIVELANILFNMQTDTSDETTMNLIKLTALFMSTISFILPSMYLKFKASRINFNFIKDLPILQLFILLMLKAKRPLNEVLYVLSTTKTIYKPIFQSAYRIYIRDTKEALNYLEIAFKDTKFQDTIIVLKQYGEYSKGETIKVLENGLADITEFTNNYKRKKDIVGNLVTQLLIALPFIAAVLLGMAPLIYYGLDMMSVGMPI